jgi:1-acyl-sn-glycerol-3-phosphate acyltransferase
MNLATRVPLWLRLQRIVRLALHLLRGLFIATLRYPRLSEEQRHAEKRRWSERLLGILSVTVRQAGQTPRLPPRCMLVLNHISWLDVFVIDALFPATFVAKADIRDWPLLGRLCSLVGTIYIERGKRQAAKLVRSSVADALAQGRLIAVCPEGTTTDGHGLKPFHLALFQPAIDVAAVIQPVALRYLDEAGAHLDAPAYVGDTSFMQSLWAIVSARHIVCELSYTPEIVSAGSTRASLAQAAEVAIAAALGVAAPRSPRTPSGTPVDLPAG